MRVSPKYIIQLCQKGTKSHKRSHKYKEKGRRSIACIAGTLLVKRVPKKRTKKGRPRPKDRVVVKPVEKNRKLLKPVE